MSIRDCLAPSLLVPWKVIDGFVLLIQPHGFLVEDTGLEYGSPRSHSCPLLIVLGLTELYASSTISSSQSFPETEEKNTGPDPELLLASRPIIPSAAESFFSPC